LTASGGAVVSTVWASGERDEIVEMELLCQHDLARRALARSD
jgi:hypothetical protein